MVSSDGVVLGLVTAVQTASSVWGRLGGRASRSPTAPRRPYEEDRALFPDCPGKFLGGICELHTVNDASDVDRLLTALAELADG
jgi:hypothetical protein